MLRGLFLIFLLLFPLCHAEDAYLEGLPLYYWQTNRFVNFGDYLSLKLVERIVGGRVKVCQSKDPVQKFLAIGSILRCANTGDVVWGTGMNGKVMDANEYKFEHLDIRAVRGPLTRDFILNVLGIDCPETYGDPALLLPYFFPEFVRDENPEYDYIIIPHYSEISLFPKKDYPNVVYPTEPWRDVVRKILNSKFVIASSLHGLVVADAFGVPARCLKITDHEPLYKYQDYYLGTDRPNFQFAASIQEALQLGGEEPFHCDLKKLYQSFPFEYWPEAEFINPFAE